MPPSRMLVDSSFLIALFDRNESQFESVNAIADLYRGRFLIPQVALTEAAYMLRRETSVHEAATFLRAFVAWEPTLQDVSAEDVERAAEIMDQYADADLDFVDCCIMALSERLNVRVVLTLDQRDFSIFRPRHCDYLRILPEA